MKWENENFIRCFLSLVRYRKKIVVFLITVTLGIGALIMCSGQSSTKGTELENSKSESSSLFGNDPNFSKSTNSRLGSQELFFKMMVSVVFLVALGAAAIYVSKKFLPKITNLPGKEIRIAETVHLGPRRAVHLLEVGERRFLIGSTNENITKLADLTNAFSELSIEQIDSN